MSKLLSVERLLHSQGFGTRRHCRALACAGLFCVDGVAIDDPDQLLDPQGLVFDVDGERWTYQEKAYLLLNKPAGYECSRQPKHHPSVFMLLPPPLLERDVQSVGRLDHDTTGLLLFSDDGQFIHRMTSPKKGVGKVYEVTTADAVTASQCEALLAGVVLHDDIAPVAALACDAPGSHQLRLQIAEGKYHQVKRMVAAAGNHVTALHRSAIGGLRLPADLAPGEWRWLTADEHRRLAEPASFS